MAEAAHSKWSASGFEGVMLCPGKPVMERGKPDNANEYAAEGTSAHLVLTWALTEKKPAAAYIGRTIHIDPEGRPCEAVRRKWSFDVTQEMADYLQGVIDYVHDVAGEHGVILVDRKVNYARYLDVPEDEAWGTLDVIILLPDEIVSIDLKYGRGVEVSAGYDIDGTRPGEALEETLLSESPSFRRPNPQCALYALGALTEFGELGDFKRARMVICQPRVSSAPSTYDMTIAELEAWAHSTARSAVNSARVAADFSKRGAHWEQTFLRPGEKQCKFCRAKATCPGLTAEVAKHVTFSGAAPATPEEFDELPDSIAASTIEVPHQSINVLSRWMQVGDLIEDWLKAVRAETERRLLAGEGVPGYKLVEGRLGNRSWSDKAAAEKLLKDMRIKQDDMYDFSLKNPTQIAKLGPQFDKEGKPVPLKEGQAQPIIGPRQWPKVAALIYRAPGAKHVAPVSDPRPALVVTAVADDFADVSAEDFA